MSNRRPPAIKQAIGGTWPESYLLIEETDMPQAQKAKFTAAFKAGFVACALLVGGVVIYVGDLVVKTVWREWSRKHLTARRPG